MASHYSSHYDNQQFADIVYRMGRLETRVEALSKSMNDVVATRLVGVEARLKSIEGQLNDVGVYMDEATRVMKLAAISRMAAEHNAQARDQNSYITSPEMHICPLRNRDNNTQVACPKTLTELQAWGPDQMAKLLNELGEDYRIVADIDRVKWVLGIRIGKNAQRFD
ncbi:hypothetical protein TrVFT333_000833 [Trichoderma virens FT-333]|nr:hypothetical protein TrVFT333_000833 [Trichoderma virens FT-333]